MPLSCFLNTYWLRGNSPPSCLWSSSVLFEEHKELQTPLHYFWRHPVCLQPIGKLDAEKVLRLLRGHPFARVRIPNRKKMREFADMVTMREPMVDGIIGFMDGVSFPAKCTNEHVKQNAMYCSYECNTMVNNLFAYGPDGMVFLAAINFPGSWAD